MVSKLLTMPKQNVSILQVVSGYVVEYHSILFILTILLDNTWLH